MVSPGILGNNYLVMTQVTNVKNTLRNTELNKYQERFSTGIDTYMSNKASQLF